MKDKKYIGVNLPETQYLELKSVAEKDRRSLSNTVALAIEFFLKKGVSHRAA